jgi:16S rRNA processing protein RimM
VRVSDPMAYNYGILLGRITKVSGYEGAVAVKLERNFSGKIPHIESVFLEIEGRPVPFFVSGSDYSGADILKLKFDGYDSSDRVDEFTGCRIFLTTVRESENTSEDFQSLEGYNIMTPDKKLLGTVTEVIQNPGQWLLDVASPAGKSMLIPLHEHFLVKIDKKKKIMVMDIPEGLTEIN